MCLAVLALRCIPGVPVLVAANRDEFHARPTAPAARWPGAPAIYAGRDLQAGGTWMGATDGGRFALVTNYREPGRHLPDAPSRGALVQDWLQGTQTAADYMARLHARGALYNGFNLIVGDLSGAWYYGNRGGAPRALGPGVHSLSNHLLDTPWPKVVRIRDAFARIVADAAAPQAPPSTQTALPEPLRARLYAMLYDRQPAPDADLPDTGLARDRERLLSSPFIVSPDYGTRVSTVLALRADGRGELLERRFDPQGDVDGDTALAFGGAAAA